MVILDLDGNTQDTGIALAHGMDGRLYLAAWSRVLDDTTAPFLPSLLAFDAGGEAVSGFGANGRVPTSSELPQAIAVRSDGAVFMASSTIVSIRSPTGALQAQLSLPTTMGSGYMFATSLAVQSDDSVVVAGGFSRGAPISDGWTLARVRPDGSLDSTFGDRDGGWTLKDAGESGQISAVRIQPGGKLLAIGPGLHATPVAVVGRFNAANGTTDFAFGTNGLVTLPSCAPFCRSPRLAVDSVGRIYVGGGSQVLMRLNVDGSPDASYASVATDPAIQLVDLAVDSADRVVVFGVVFGQPSETGYVARFLPSGARDPSFGTGGEVLIQPGSASPPQADLVAGIVLPNDKPVALLSVAGEWDGAPTLDGPYSPTDLALVQLTVAGSIDAPFGGNDVDPDVYPDTFAFTNNTAPFGTTSVVSNTVTVGGINARTSVHIASATANSAYSIGCTGNFVASHGTLLPGETLCLRHSSSSQPGGTAQTLVNVGGRIVSYTTVSSSQAADTQPDGFAFVDQTGVTPGATVTSNAITITGLTGASPVAIDGGSYSVGCDPQGFRTSNGSITNGQTICVRHVASSQHSAVVDTTLAIGGVTDTFTSTTAPPDTTPEPFTLPVINGVQPGSVVVSSPVTIAGIDSPAPISVMGGEYSIGCGGSWTSAAGTIALGQQVCVRHTAASQPSSSVTTTLTIGGISAGFVSTTMARSSGGGGGALSLQDIGAFVTLLLVSLLRTRRLPPRPRRSYIAAG